LKHLADNFSIMKVFFLIQGIAFILFFFEKELAELFNSNLTYNTTEHHLIYLFYLIISTVFFGMVIGKFKVPDIKTYEIYPPLVLHFFLIIFQVIYLLKFRSFSNSSDFKRFASLDDPIEWKFLSQISIVFLYSSTAIISGAYFKIKDDICKIQYSRFLLSVLFGTFFLFLAKDISVASRGSILNFFVLFISGAAYTGKLNLNIKTIIYLLVMVCFFLFLTYLRAGEVLDLSIIHDSIIAKFSANFEICYMHLNGTLEASRGFVKPITMENTQNLQWPVSSDLNMYSLDKLDFFPAYKSFISKYLFGLYNFKPSSIYFNVLENNTLPFNSYNYLLQLFVGGLTFCSLVAILILGLRNYAYNFLHSNYLIFVLFFYTAALSFTSLAIIDLPFILLPLISFLFNSCFKLRYNEQILLRGFK